MTTFSNYTVPPFSGENYYKNSQKENGDFSAPCAICGKPVKGEPKHVAVVIKGGSEWGDEDSDEDDAGYMGEWPVGNDCHRRHVVKQEHT